MASEGHEPCVMISVEEYRRLARRKREVFLASEIPDEDWAEIERGLRNLNR